MERQSDVDSDIEGRVRAFWEQAFNGRDLDLIDAITAPEFFNRNALPGTPAGPEGHRQAVERLWEAFPDAHFEILLLASDGGREAVSTSSALGPPNRADRGDRAQVLDQDSVDGESALA